MRNINGVYSQRFNRAHASDGHLFRGRYKSILVDADSYLLDLLRYIHRNPLEAGSVDRLNSYTWSSHKGYLTDAKKKELASQRLCPQNVLGEQGRKQKEIQKIYSGGNPRRD